MAEPAPRSPRELFSAFSRLALQGFGGVLPVTQRVLVENQRWLSQTQFLELLSLSQVLPGPNIVNLALIFGDRCFGWRGAVAATAGVMLAPLGVVLVLAALAQQLQGVAVVDHALRGMGVVSAGLVLSTGLRLALGLRGNPLGPALCAICAGLTLLAVGALRWPLAWVVLGLGASAMALAWWRIAR